MAETAIQVILSPFLEVIFGDLNSLIRKEFRLLWGVNRDLERLSSTLSTIRCVLKDAEEMQISETAARDWLRKLKDAAFDAEDILDECQVEALQFESDIDRKTCYEQVSHSFSTCFDFRALLFRRRMGKQIKLLAEKFEEIANERKFHLNPAIVESGVEQLGLNRETSSTLTEPIIYGRDEERDLVVQRLLSNVNSQNNLSISPILGLGGLGKTTLAQLVYNDERISDQFDAKIWICVSEDFGIKRIAKMVLDHLSGNASALVDLDAIQNQTRKLMHGKKFLLVLDDVWDDSQEHWNQMIMYLLSCGDKGSSVIVTTRLQTVITTMTRIETSMALIIHPALDLQTLSKRDCWSLFKHYAFGPGVEKNQNFAELGQEIVGKCGGLPLAVKALGGLLHLQNEKFWRTVNDNEIWNLQKHGEHGILPVLRLSYNHLPQVLRQCFAFCAVYPKNYKFEKDKLVNQWIANGFIQSNDNMEVEDTGDMVFNELFRRSFFLKMNEVSKYDEIHCKIHDLMHDLACSVMVEECLKIKIADTKDVPRRVRHMYVEYESQFSQSTLQKFSGSQPFLHTLIFGYSSSGNTLDSLYSSFSKLKFLKVLTLSPRSSFKKLPLWIGHLKHLRYLDLTETNITSLPEFICSLKTLQTLNLSENNGLEMVTPSVGKLVNLRCLDLSYTRIKELPQTICNLTNLQFLNLLCVDLKHLPNTIGNMKSLRYLHKCNRHKLLTPLIKMTAGIGELTCLETILPIHLVSGGDNRSERGGIQELERLNCLKGKLEIHGLQNVDDPRDAQRANLKTKTNLSQLELGWEWASNSTSSEGRNQFNVLRVLQPHRYLQELKVEGYTEKLLPSWMGDFAASLPKLTSLILGYMCNVEGWLPSESIEGEEVEKKAPQNHLILPPSLKILAIRECPNLKIQDLPSSIEELGVGRSNDPTLSWVNTLPHLSTLAIVDFHDGLPEASFQNLLHLHSLFLANCSELKLSKMFQTLAGKLRKLRFWKCKIEEEEDEGLEYQLGSLQKLNFKDCESLKSLYWWQHLTALQTLKLYNCPNLDISAVGFQHLGTLRFLHFSKLPQLSSLPDGIQHLTRLQMLYIGECKNLIMLPEWMQQDHLLPALQVIRMVRCHPELHRRYARDKGEDWHKISHLYIVNIPN